MQTFYNYWAKGKEARLKSIGSYVTKFSTRNCIWHVKGDTDQENFDYMRYLIIPSSEMSDIGEMCL